MVFGGTVNSYAPNDMIARLKQPSRPRNAVIAKGETEGKLQMLLSPRKNGLTSLFNKEVRVFKATAAWRVLSNPPLQLEDPSLKPQPFPPHPPPPSSPHPLGSFCDAPGGGGSGWHGGGVLGRKGVDGGGPSNRHLGPDPHLGALDKGI